MASSHPSHKPQPWEKASSPKACRKWKQCHTQLQFMVSYFRNESSKQICSYRAALHSMLIQLEIRAGRQPLSNKGRIFMISTTVWTLGQSFIQCHIKLTAANIMELNELPVDGGETPAGSCLLTRKNALDGRNSCNFSGLQSQLQFESCEKPQEILLWNILLLPTSVGSHNMEYFSFIPESPSPRLERVGGACGAKCKGKTSGYLGSLFISK